MKKLYTIIAVVILAALAFTLPAQAQTGDVVLKFPQADGSLGSVTLHNTACDDGTMRGTLDEMVGKSMLDDPTAPPPTPTKTATWFWGGKVSPGCYIVNPITGGVFIVDEAGAFFRPVPHVTDFRQADGA